MMIEMNWYTEAKVEFNNKKKDRQVNQITRLSNGLVLLMVTTGMFMCVSVTFSCG